jgi:alkylation response protein AidB-like acyl-CoA dehydrogenase
MKPPTHLDVAKESLRPLGRMMVRKRYGDFWEEETRTLPWTMRRLRRQYREFAEKRLKPRALEVDCDTSALDKDALFLEYAKRGWATELLPPPVGTLSPFCLRNYGLNLVLKVEELFAACGGIALFLGAHDLGFMPLIMSGSWPAFRDWARPIYKRIKGGERIIWAFAITEPGAGSDVEDTEGAMKARVTTRAKKVSGGYRISGRKCFISDGGVADYVTVFACMGDEGVESWTCFVVEKGMEGFSLGRQEKKMGQKGGDATELILEDVFVPDKNRVGPERSGWGLNRSVLNFSRPAVGAIGMAIGRGAFEHCLEFCQNTRLGNKRLIEYQDVQIELAEMMIRIWASRAMVWNAQAHFMPAFAAMSAAVKVFCSDTGVSVCEKAMEIMGDHAYVHGNSVEKALRDARLTQIYEGTNQINRLALIEDLWESDVSKGRA